MQQMNLDSEGATHSGMEGHSRSSHKYLLLQVWCGLLTVAVVVMAVFLSSIKSKSPEDTVSTLKPDNVIPTVNTSPLKSDGSSPSFIQLIKTLKNSWEESPGCVSCSLVLSNGSIHFKKTSLYLIYAQVNFSERKNKTQAQSVILRREATFGKNMRKLVEGTFPSTTEGSVWVAKIVNLKEGDIVSLDIPDNHRLEGTFWGAYQLL
ncbi:lymphotoxin-alpha [Platichthys flesus]|uniref:lymphotoxin-alpha n=1 Tax=Platichthys flesus TaxID=8260 RepID=UPI002DBABBB4|nr:lymphotoxin-alpha [Platichthys flesus]